MQRSIYKSKLRKFTKYLTRRHEWRDGRDSHTREACTSESNPGRGADMEAQMGKPTPQGLASGDALTSDGRGK